MNSARILIVALTAFLQACVLLPTYGGPPPSPKGKDSPPPIPWHDYRGVIHCHSYLSHDSDGTEEDIVKAANAVGIDFLIMTDHYTDEGIQKGIRGFRGKTLFMVGGELKEKGGSLLVLGLQHPLKKRSSALEIVEEVHQQGGLVFLGHLEKYRGSFEEIPFDGFEIYNLHAAASEANPIAVILRGIFLPPNCFFRALITPLEKNIKLWEEWLPKRPVPIIAGNDSHANVRLFGPLGGTVGTYEETFRTVTTHVWASSLEPKEILNALREGRSYISFDALRDATGFSVVPIGEGSYARWRIFVPESARIVMRSGGEIVGEAKGQWLEVPFDTANKIYRVEVYLSGKLWILAGPFISPDPNLPQPDMASQCHSEHSKESFLAKQGVFPTRFLSRFAPSK